MRATRVDKELRQLLTVRRLALAEERGGKLHRIGTLSLLDDFADFRVRCLNRADRGVDRLDAIGILKATVLRRIVDLLRHGADLALVRAGRDDEPRTRRKRLQIVLA